MTLVAPAAVAAGGRATELLHYRAAGAACIGVDGQAYLSTGSAPRTHERTAS